jgi:uncharacterized protein YgiB involved in biofilm formation
MSKYLDSDAILTIAIVMAILIYALYSRYETGNADLARYNTIQACYAAGNKDCEKFR